MKHLILNIITGGIFMCAGVALARDKDVLFWLLNFSGMIMLAFLYKVK